MKQKFDITGMSCASCSAHVEKSVSKVAGVQEVQVNLLTNSMTVVYDDSVTSSGEIVSAVEKPDTALVPSSGKRPHRPIPPYRYPARIRAQGAEGNEAAADNFLSLPDSFILPVYGTHDGTSDPLVFPGGGKRSRIRLYPASAVSAHRVVNRHYFTGGFAALWHRSPNMDSLIGIGSAAALVYGRLGYLPNRIWPGPRRPSPGPRVFYGPLL